MSAQKQPEEIRNRSGVYRIRCKRNGMIYVGSAGNLQARWDLHRRKLRAGLHHNPHLQNAWKVYGESCFEFVVLQYVELGRLLDTEQLWIDRTGCTDRRIGFNIQPQATSGGSGIGQTWLGFRDPNGNPITIVNLSDFCRRNRLDFPSMHRLSKGESKLKSYKGWTHANSVRQRDYIKRHDGFIAPGGAHTRITNLTAFCRASGLCKVHMFELKSGKRLSHKGWTWKHDADQAFE